jgi:hypothetical protein
MIKMIFSILVIFILFILIKIAVDIILIPLEEFIILTILPVTFVNLQMKYLLISVAN